MSPPAIARAIVAISAPPSDFESVCGDLHEEYARILAREGRPRADAWYWSQAIRSVPSLLSYSRVPRSISALVLTVALVLVAIVAMLCVNELVDDTIVGAYRAAHGTAWIFFIVGPLVAASFGALIAAVRRSYGIRLVLFSACGLLAFIAVPILFQWSSRLSAATWILIVAASASMCIGGALYHLAARRRLKD